MSWLHNLFHRQPTAFPQADVFTRINSIEGKQLKYELELSLLQRNLKDFEEKTVHNLERYRARSQSRKNGKFGPEDLPGSTINPQVVANPTHDQILAEARSQGLIP